MPLVGKMGRWKGQGGGFDPLEEISWDVYYNASLITGLSDDDQVVTWEDAGSTGNDATQPTESFRPLYKTGVINSKPVVRFTADAYNLSTPFYRTTGWTAFHVVRKNAGNELLPCLASDSFSPYSLFPYSDGNIYIANRTNRVNFSDPATTFALWTVSNSSGDVLRVWKNGVLQSTTLVGDAHLDSFKYLGFRANGFETATGDMAHVSCADSELSQADREAMDNYLGDLYGLTITH